MAADAIRATTSGLFDVLGKISGSDCVVFTPSWI